MRIRRTIVGIVGALAVGVYFLWPTILRVMAQEALLSAQRDGARISWEGLEVSGFTVSVESFGAWLPGPRLQGGIRPPIKIDLERSQIHVRPISLVLFDPIVDFSLAAYGGSIEGTIIQLRTSPRITTTFHGVDLAKHDQFRALGIASAVISGVLSEFKLVNENSPQGSFDVDIRQIEVPNPPQSIPLIKLSSLSDGTIHVRGTLDPDSVDLAEVKITSSYGAVDGAGRALNLTRKGSESAEGEFRVSIGEALHSQIAQLLPALSNNVLQPSTRAFKARMKGFPCSREPRALGDLQLGTLCLRFSPVGAL